MACSVFTLGIALLMIVLGTPVGRVYGGTVLGLWLIFETTPWGKDLGRRLIQHELSGMRAKLARLEAQQ